MKEAKYNEIETNYVGKNDDQNKNTVKNETISSEAKIEK